MTGTYHYGPGKLIDEEMWYGPSRWAECESLKNGRTVAPDCLYHEDTATLYAHGMHFEVERCGWHDSANEPECLSVVDGRVTSKTPSAAS